MRVTDTNNVLAVTERELDKHITINNLCPYADYSSVSDHTAHMSKSERT